jgi:hypothetical protein
MKVVEEGSSCTMDEKMWDWSGLKDLDEIYNFRLEAKAIWDSFDGKNNELRFIALGLRDEQRENELKVLYRP